MAKSIPSSGAGAVRIILKNKDAFHSHICSWPRDGHRLAPAGA